MIQILRKLGIDGVYNNTAEWKQTHSQYYVEWEKLGTFALRTELRQGWIFISLPFNIVPEALARTTSQYKQIKRLWIGKEKFKLSPFAGWHDPVCKGTKTSH